MATFNLVSNYFHRRGWNETWDYPMSGSLIGLEKNVPALSPFYFSWETNYTPWAVITFTRTHYWLAPFASMLYLLFVWMGQKIMEKRRPFDLRNPLKYWNLLLACFSLWGTVRVVPHLLVYIYNYGFLTSLCVPPIWSYSSGAVGFWITTFVFSKYFEFIDTVFIILRKKELTFLHWFHHATTLLYGWDGFIGEHPPLLHFAAINLTIHLIMYYYYYLAAVSRPPKWGILVTVLQITQMIIGVVIGCISLYFSSHYRFIPYTTVDNAFRPFELNGCYTQKSHIFAGLAIYFSFFYLFVEFFWKRYRSPRRTVPSPATKKRE